MSGLIKSIQERDPAKPSFLEVIFAYPGVHAVGMHKISHFLWSHKLRTVARIWAHIIRIFTGIEIHPGAKIGDRLFIDHGIGTVIGETVIIGNDVLVYHGVTLGGTGALKCGRRHPVVEDGVMIGAGAQVLGPITIGKNARVGANSVVTKDVPDGCTALGNPARLAECKNKKSSYGLPDNETLDPMGDTVNAMIKDLEKIKKQIKEQKKERQS